MNKIPLLSFLMIFTLITSVVSVSAEEPLKHSESSVSEDFSISPAYEQFSLKRNYPVRIQEKDVHVFWMESLEDESSLRQMPVNPRIEELEQNIKKEKKKKVRSFIGMSALAVLGGFFMYEFFTYEEQLEPERDPQSIQTKQPQFSRKRTYIFGACISFGISATFLFSGINAKKRIKSYEKELKELREAQEKISFRRPKGSE